MVQGLAKPVLLGFFIVLGLVLLAQAESPARSTSDSAPKGKDDFYVRARPSVSASIYRRKDDENTNKPYCSGFCNTNRFCSDHCYCPVPGAQCVPRIFVCEELDCLPGSCVEEGYEDCYCPSKTAVKCDSSVYVYQ